MSSGKRIVKLLATIFGIILATGIIFSIIYGIFKLYNIFGGRIENIFNGSWKSEQVSIYDEDVNIYDVLENNDISEINIDLGGTNLEIIQGDYPQIIVTDRTNKINKSVSGNTLTIKERDISGISFSINDEENMLKLYIPEEVVIEKINLNVGAGNVHIKNLNLEKFICKFGAGNVELNNIVTRNADISTGVGKTVMKNMKIASLDLSTGIGETVYEGYILDDSKIDKGIGKIDLTLKGNYDNYLLDVDKGIGSVNIEKNNTSSNQNNDSDKIKLKISSGIGKVNLKFVD